MFLRQIFEATGTSIGLVFGRFNPPHKGHRAAWEMASKATYWYVGTNKSTQGPKDPLPYDVKVEAMSTIWPEVADHIMPEQSWLTLASHCFNTHKDATTLICFTDEDWVTKTIQQYNGKEGPHGFYNFKVIKQQPTPRLSSATALRDAVANGNREAFSQAAGVSADTEVAGQPFFDLVAQYLLPYTNAPKKVSKKKAVAEPTEAMLPKSAFAGSSKNKLGPAAHLKGSMKRPAKAGDLVGGAAQEAFSQAAADKNKIKYQKAGRIGNGVGWKEYGDDYSSLVSDIVNKFDNITRLVQYDQAPEPTKYKIVERFFKKYGYPFELFNDVITAIEKRVAGETNRFNKQGVAEAEKTLKNSNPCWKGYKPVGTKKKGGRTVPNCVPVSENVENIMSILIERLSKK
jgi:hypothetical protein